MMFSKLIELVGENFLIKSVQISHDCSFSDVFLLSEQIKLYNEDTLYIGQVAQIDRRLPPPRHVLCFGDAGAVPLSEETNWAQIREEDFSPVFNLVKQELLRVMKAESTYVKMLEMLLMGKGMSSVLDEAARLLGNPLAILDVSGKIFAHSTPFNVSDPLWITSVERGYCPLDFMDHIKQMRGKRQLIKGNEAFVSVCESNRLAYLCSRILSRKELLGYVFMFEEDTAFNSQGKELLPMIGLAAAEVMLRSQSETSVKSGLYRSILKDMLVGIDPEHAKARIQASELVFPETMRVMVLRPTYYHGENYIKGQLQGELLDIFKAPSLYHQGNLIQVVPVDEKGRMDQASRDALDNLLETGGLLAGISNEFTLPSQFAQYHSQADESLRFAQRLGREGTLHFYSDLAFYALLNNMPFELKLGRFCHPALGQLRKHDMENGTELYKTLKVYTETGFNQKRTSELLYLHRNTLNYRRQRITEVCGIDYEDPDVLFLLMYSFKIDSFLEHKLQ